MRQNRRSCSQARAAARPLAGREQSQIGLGTSAESVDEELARLDKACVKAVSTKISREPVGIERTLDNPKLPTVLESPELSRALAIGQAQPAPCPDAPAS